MKRSRGRVQIQGISTGVKRSRGRVQVQEIRKISRSGVVDGIETEAGNCVRNMSSDGLFENWCDVLCT